MAPAQSNVLSGTVNPSSRQFRVMFWNARSIRKRKEELQQAISSVDILVVVESWLEEGEAVDFTGFRCFRQDRLNRTGGGIVFYLRNKIEYEDLKIISFSNLVEICGIRILNASIPFNLIACYRIPSSAALPKVVWDSIVDTAKIGRNSLLLSDFNAHHRSWNCENTDCDGNRFLSSMEEGDLFLHNPSSKTHFDVHTGKKSNIDLILSSLSLADKINFSVSHDAGGSDHFPISISLDIQKCYYVKKSFRLTSVKTDWNKYVSLLESKLHEFFSCDYDSLSPSGKYSLFIQVLRDCVKGATPGKRKVSKHFYRNPVPWWDEDCGRAVRLRQAAFKKWEFSVDLEDLLIYKDRRREARSLLKVRKRDFFRKFAETLDFRTDLKYTWKKCRILNNKWVRTRHSSSPENCVSRKSEAALNELCPEIPFASSDPLFIPPSPPNPLFDSPFTYEEFKIALSSRKTQTAPGMDGCTVDMLNSLPFKFKLLLIDIFNEIHASGDFPPAWSDTYVHFIDKKDFSSMRPIALTSCLCKLYESIIKLRLDWWIEFNDILPKSQTGFRKGRSCTDNLTNLSCFVQEGFSEKKDTLAVFLDVKGAFPNVNSDILLQRLADIGCSSSILKFVKFLTHSRKIFSSVNEEAPRALHKGVPIGVVLSPTLYCIYVSKIVEDLPENIAVSQFADDICLYSRITPVQECIKALESAVTSISQKLFELGLELCTHKTVFVHFTKKKDVRPGSTEIIIGDSKINSVARAKFLGILFDHKLTFSDQVFEVQKKCQKAINIIKYLCGTWWGSDPSTLLTLYKSIVRSRIDYGGFVYFPTRKDMILKLERIQFSGIRAALGYRLSTPTNVLLAESKVHSLLSRSQFLAIKFCLKTLSNTSMSTFDSLTQYNRMLQRKRCRRKPRVLASALSYSLNSSQDLQRDCHFRPFRISYSSLFSHLPLDWSLGRQISLSDSPAPFLNNFVTESGCLSIFTDGSKSPSGS